MQPRQVVKQYLLKNFLFTEDQAAISDQDSLFLGGILDSTGIYELILHIEEAFQLTIAPEDMIPDNFDTIDKIDAFVARKRAG